MADKDNSDELCCICKEQLDAGSLSISGRLNFHERCFKCIVCSQLLKGEEFMVDGEKVYCKEDFVALRAPKCGYCEKPVTAGTKALGKAWHANHFLCGVCEKPITSKKFKGLDGKPYHPEECFGKARADICFTCGELIEEQVLSAVGRKFHPDHLRCHADDELIPVGSECHRVTDQLLCDAHYTLSYVRRCKICMDDLDMHDTYIKTGPFYYHQ
eukprot:277225_1